MTHQPLKAAPPVNANIARPRRAASTADSRDTANRMLLILPGYQPLVTDRAIRRCPLPQLTTQQPTIPIVGWSVALHAPRRPKCPRSAGGSMLPYGWRLVPKYYAPRVR